MNYRHAFHAGNFADVLKHATLALVIESLKRKDTPFRVIDTHAGIGLYDLTSPEAMRSPEWQGGIARIHAPGAAPLPDTIAEILAPYLGVVASVNPDADLRYYPGSPVIARALLRWGDGLTLTEHHPADAATLAARFDGDRQTKVIDLDGWLAVKSFLPPKERRGVVLIDPPYEDRDEFAHLGEAVRHGMARFAHGTYLLWYPIKDRAAVANLHRLLDTTCGRPVLVAELAIAAPKAAHGLMATGLAIINPPWKLAEALAALLPFLVERLAVGEGAGYCLETIGVSE